MESKNVFFVAHLASADCDSVFARIVYKFRYAQTLAAWLSRNGGHFWITGRLGTGERWTDHFYMWNDPSWSLFADVCTVWLKDLRWFVCLWMRPWWNKNHGIPKLVVWRSQTSPIHIQSPLLQGPVILRDIYIYIYIERENDFENICLTEMLHWLLHRRTSIQHVHFEHNSGTHDGSIGTIA